MKHTKRILALLLASLMVLSLAACGSDAKTPPTKNGDVRPTQSDPLEKDRGKDEKNNPGPDDNSEPAETGPGPIEDNNTVNGDGFIIVTDSGPGAHLQDTVPEVSEVSYDWSNYTTDDEYGYYNFEMPVALQESSLTKQLHELGEFETLDAFKEVWTPYAQALFTEVEHGGLMSDVQIYGESERGDNLFGSDKDQHHSFSLTAQMDNYQAVTYSYTMFVATDEESWDRYDYSEVISYIQHYTGIVLTSGDVREMQRMIAEQLDAGADTWTVEVQSNEKDNYDSFRITGSVFTENSQSWSFVAERMISKWADLYDRDALINSAFSGTGSETGINTNG